MSKRFCLILSLVIGVVLLAVLPALAESVDTAWVRRYDGPENSTDEATAIAVDASGNVYVTGWSYGSGTDSDYATIKYLPNGDVAPGWPQRYNGPGNYADKAYGIAVDDSNNVYVTGWSYGSGTGDDYATIKYYPDGETAWVKRYNGPGNASDYAYAISVDGSGNVYVTGMSYGNGTSYDYATIKYLPSGDVATGWPQRYNGPGNHDDRATAMAVDDSGYVYVTGWSAQVPWPQENFDYVTIKYYPDGDTAWLGKYNGPADRNDFATAIAVDDSGYVYVTGESKGSGTETDYATIKYYPDGDTAWVRRYDGPENWDYAWAIAVDDSGNVYVTGESDGSGTYEDYATIKYYADGDTAWVRRYDGPAHDEDHAYAIALDASNNVYVTGRSVGGASVFDYATIKYYSNGDTAWVMRYNGLENGSDEAYAIAVYGCDDVYVTGSSVGDGTGSDYATIKYDQYGNDVKDETGDREKPSEFTLSQNYPNPFNQTTKIEFTLAKSGFVSLNIYDILGRKVRTLVSEHLSSGYKSVLWDGKNDSGKDAASGIYFYQLKVEDPASGGVGDFSESKKLVLLK